MAQDTNGQSLVWASVSWRDISVADLSAICHTLWLFAIQERMKPQHRQWKATGRGKVKAFKQGEHTREILLEAETGEGGCGSWGRIRIGGIGRWTKNLRDFPLGRKWEGRLNPLTSAVPNRNLASTIFPTWFCGTVESGVGFPHLAGTLRAAGVEHWWNRGALEHWASGETRLRE